MNGAIPGGFLGGDGGLRTIAKRKENFDDRTRDYIYKVKISLHFISSYLASSFFSGIVKCIVDG